MLGSWTHGWAASPNDGFYMENLKPGYQVSWAEMVPRNRDVTKLLQCKQLDVFDQASEGRIMRISRAASVGKKK